MQWSKLKKQVESHFASSVSGRVELRSTRYRESHDREGRAWITLDGEELYDFCTWRTIVSENQLVAGIRAANRTEDFRDPRQRAGYFEASEQAQDINGRQGIHNQYEFYQAVEEFLSLPISAVLASPNLIVRALGMLDSRLGKRRLRGMILASGEHPLIRRLYEFRCSVERVRPQVAEA
jgi:hypothetical protein